MLDQLYRPAASKHESEVPNLDRVPSQHLSLSRCILLLRTHEAARGASSTSAAAGPAASSSLAYALVLVCRHDVVFWTPFVLSTLPGHRHTNLWLPHHCIPTIGETRDETSAMSARVRRLCLASARACGAHQGGSGAVWGEPGGQCLRRQRSALCALGTLAACSEPLACPGTAGACPTRAEACARHSASCHTPTRRLRSLRPHRPHRPHALRHALAVARAAGRALAGAGHDGEGLCAHRGGA